MRLIAALAASAAAATAQPVPAATATGSRIPADAARSNNRPVAKVLTLLRDMQQTVEGERTSDRELHQKMDCWCKTNRGEKESAIEAAEQATAQLTSTINENTARRAELKAAIEGLEGELAEKNKSLATAGKVRGEEKAAFEKEHADIVETLAALEKALKILGTQHGSNGETHGNEEEKAAATAQLLQTVRAMHSTSTTSLSSKSSIGSEYMRLLQKDLWALNGALQGPAVSNGTALLEQAFSGETGVALVQEPAPTGGVAGVRSYNSRSGEIFGLLGEMRDEFERDGAKALADERAAVEAFAQLTATLNEGITATNRSIKDKQQLLAAARQTLTQAKKELGDTGKNLHLDREFLHDLNVECTTADNEYDQRLKARNTELEALSEAISYLTSDEARDLFSRSLPAGSFTQTASQTAATARVRARVVVALQTAATSAAGHASLLRLVASAKLDAFTKVVDMMDNMAKELKRQQADEVAHRDWCLVELDTNEDTVHAQELQHEDLSAAIAQLESDIGRLTADNERLVGQIGEMRSELKAAGEQRAAENHNYQAVVHDQRATQEVLLKTLDRLRQVYEPENTEQARAAAEAAGTAPLGLAQEPGRASSPAPRSAKAYSTNAAAPGVLGVIQEVIADAKALEGDAVQAEQDSQSAYSKLVRETNAGVTSRQKATSDNVTALSQAKGDRADAESAVATVEETLKKLSDMNVALHKSCDFVVKNFDARQEARGQEMDAIARAKSILRGAK